MNSILSVLGQLGSLFLGRKATDRQTPAALERRIDDDPPKAQPAIAALRKDLDERVGERNGSMFLLGLFCFAMFVAGFVATSGGLFFLGAAVFGAAVYLTHAFATPTINRFRGEIRRVEDEDRDYFRRAHEWQQAWRNQLRSLADFVAAGAWASPHNPQRSVSDRSVYADQRSAAGLSLEGAERVLVECAAAMWGIHDQGYSLSAGFSGKVRTTGASVAAIGERVAVSVSSMRGDFGGEITGSLTRREGKELLDEGVLYVTDRRVVFIGMRRTHEIRLESLLGARGVERMLELRWPEQRSAEHFETACADLLADIVLGARTLRAGQMSTAPVTTLSRELSQPTRLGGIPRDDAPGERECPWCAEIILAKARVCKHCGRDVV